MKTAFLRALAIATTAIVTSGVHAANPATTVMAGLKNPESVCIGPQGLLYVSEIGEIGKDGDGRIVVIEDGKARTFFGGLDDLKGIVFMKDAFYVADKKRVVKIGADGELRIFQQFLPANFPKLPMFLNDIAVDVPNEVLLVSDSGDIKGNGGAVYRIDTRSGAIETVEG